MATIRKMHESSRSYSDSFKYKSIAAFEINKTITFIKFEFMYNK